MIKLAYNKNIKRSTKHKEDSKMENYGLTDGTIETLTEKAEKIMGYYDSYKLDAREWKNYGKHRVYVTVGGYFGDRLKKTYKLAWVDMDNGQQITWQY